LNRGSQAPKATSLDDLKPRPDSPCSRDGYSLADDPYASLSAPFASYAFLLETKGFPSTKNLHGSSFALLIPILGDAFTGTASSLSLT
jgi:hypothetical protein